MKRKLDWPFDPRWLLHYGEHPPGAYQTKRVPKSAHHPDGTWRIVHDPEPALREIQLWLNPELQKRLVLHEADHAVPGRSIVTHAALHADPGILVTMDLSNFFGAVPEAAVRQALQNGLHPQDAFLAQRLCTYRGHILQGAPTSSILAAAALAPADTLLQELAEANGARYSRYADDLAFSWAQGTLPARAPGATAPHPPVVEAVKQGAAAALRSQGYALAAGKTSVAYPWEPQRVTGLVVNFEPGKPPVRAARSYWRRLRAGVYNLETRGLGDLAELRGLAAFLAMVEPAKAEPFVERLMRFSTNG